MAWGELRPLTAHLQNIVLDKPEISFGRAQVRDWYGRAAMMCLGAPAVCCMGGSQRFVWGMGRRLLCHPDVLLRALM